MSDRSGHGSCVTNFGGDALSIFLEVVLEHGNQPICGRVVRIGVRPCGSGLEHLRWDARAGGGNLEPESRIHHVFHIIEITVQCGIEHGTSVRYRHSRPDTVRPTGPTGVDQQAVEPCSAILPARRSA